ncbi:MAG TPA: hypothetical protein VNA69_24710 [Thermoanaerobaculia bacterium]|nr:hypothetical protein [Thermoanaerobaculia bacterium]
MNDTLNANPAINEARARVPKAGLKFQVTAPQDKNSATFGTLGVNFRARKKVPVRERAAVALAEPQAV